MTKPCAKCGQSVEESSLIYGRCHACRVEFRELESFSLKACGRNGLAKPVEPNPAPSIAERLRWAAERIERQNRSQAKKSENSDDLTLDEWISRY